MATITFITIITALLGLIIGSFLTVCIYRIPAARADELLDPNEEDSENLDLKLQDKNISKEELDAEKNQITFLSPARSICPNCQKQLKWYHNIPVFSWLFLGGKCNYCKAKIPLRYPLVELTSAIAAVSALLVYGFTPTAALVYIFACALIVITVIDYDYYIIPNVITYPGTIIGIIISIINQNFQIFDFPVVGSIYEAFWGVIFGAGFLYLVAEVYLKLRKIDGLGLGDVKLLAMTGVLFGAECAVFTIFVGSLLGSILGIGAIILKGRKFTQYLPFGPYLAAGSIIYLYIGTDTLLELLKYLGLIGY